MTCFTYVSVGLFQASPVYLSIYLSLYLNFSFPPQPLSYLSTVYIYIYMYVCIYLSIYLSMFICSYLTINLSIDLLNFSFHLRPHIHQSLMPSMFIVEYNFISATLSYRFTNAPDCLREFARPSYFGANLLFVSCR